MRKILLPILLTILAFGFLGLIKTTKADGVISIWWPVSGIRLAEHQPFKALVNGKDLSEYEMYWQVDGGHLNSMADNMSDHPHKEATVDLRNWNWKGDGPYEINFVAKDKAGLVIDQSKVSILTSNQQTTQLQAMSIKYPKTPGPAPITTTIPQPTYTPVITSTPTITPVSMEQGIRNNYQQLFVDKSGAVPDISILQDKIASQPQARWFGGWNSNIESDVLQYTTASLKEDKTAVLVVYNIPKRDCGGDSAGGSNTTDDYLNWINSFSDGIVGTPIVILEPDALALMDCLNVEDRKIRANLISQAVKTLKSKGARVYLDAGHSRWHGPQEISARLISSGITSADGFSLNISNFIKTDENIIYGNKISEILNGKHYIIDVSRNGNGPPDDNSWCNPRGRALGEKPYLTEGNVVDGFLWIKRPGESDGNCNGGPNAGTFWTEYAIELAKNASW